MNNMEFRIVRINTSECEEGKPYLVMGISGEGDQYFAKPCKLQFRNIIDDHRLIMTEWTDILFVEEE